MTLTFLGRKYEATQTETVAMPSEFTGKYRGVPVQFSRSQSTCPSTIQLSYRGVSYLK